MANGVFKTQGPALKWLETVSGTVLEENGAEGKWAAYVPPKKVEDDMIIGYGNTIQDAVAAVSQLINN